MMMMILAMIMIFKCLLSAIDFATRYSTRYSDFLSQPYSNPTRSQKTLLAGACSVPVISSDWMVLVYPPAGRGDGAQWCSRTISASLLGALCPVLIPHLSSLVL